jgi:hypothetical protein
MSAIFRGTATVASDAFAAAGATEADAAATLALCDDCGAGGCCDAIATGAGRGAAGAGGLAGPAGAGAGSLPALYSRWARFSVTTRLSLAKVAVFPLTASSFQPSATSPGWMIETPDGDWTKAHEEGPDSEAINPRMVKGGVSAPEAAKPAAEGDCRGDLPDAAEAFGQRTERLSEPGADG